ncbi:MAG: homoserine O-succinyltransferase [Gemmatimonadaceae bacterium]
MSLASETLVALPPYEVIGPEHAPAIVVLGGISAHRHVCASAADPRPGWWESVAGAGRPLDTTRYRLVGLDFLDGGRGPDGRPERSVTTHDQADAIAASLDDAGVARVHAVVGASYGGMVALAFAERYPERLERLIAIGAAHRSHPMTTALRAIQRRIVELGVETGRTHDALVLARALAMTTYRSAGEFEERFKCRSLASLGMTSFPVEQYLLHQGERFAATWSAERFLALSLSADLHFVEPAEIHVPTVLVAAEGDTNVPRGLVDELARETGGPCTIADLPSTNGHDAFLTEPESLGRILQTALASSVS